MSKNINETKEYMKPKGSEIKVNESSKFATENSVYGALLVGNK